MILQFDEATHTYAVDSRVVPCVSDIVEIVAGSAGKINGWQIDEDVMEEAAERGHHVHEAIRLLLADDLDWQLLDPIIGEYVTAFDQWMDVSGFVPEKIEEPFYNAELDYAGTPDLVGWYGTDFTVVDLKSGSAGKLPRHDIALAAYAFHHASSRPVRRLVVELVPRQVRKKYREKWIRDDQFDWHMDLFRAARKILTWRDINA
jgi:hypothetical protein